MPILRKENKLCQCIEGQNSEGGQTRDLDHKATDGKRQKLTAKLQVEVRESGGRGGGRTMGARGAQDSTGKYTEQLTWDHGDSNKLNCRPENLHDTDIGPLNIV